MDGWLNPKPLVEGVRVDCWVCGWVEPNNPPVVEVEPPRDPKGDAVVAAVDPKPVLVVEPRVEPNGEAV